MKSLFLLFLLTFSAIGLAEGNKKEDSQVAEKFKRFSESFVELTEEIGKEIKSTGNDVKDHANREWKPRIQKEIALLRDRLDDLVKQMESDKNESSSGEKK